MRKLISLLLIALFTTTAFAQSKTKVLVMEIRDEINPPMNRYTKLALEKATETKADIVIVDMDSFGGAVADADEIVERFLKFENQFGYSSILMQPRPVPTFPLHAIVYT